MRLRRGFGGSTTPARSTTSRPNKTLRRRLAHGPENGGWRNPSWGKRGLWRDGFGELEQGAVRWRPCRASARLLLAAGENGAHRKAPRRATMVSWSWAHGAGGWNRDAELGRRRRKAEQRRARLRAWSSAMKLGERDAGRGTASPVVTMALCREAEWRTALPEHAGRAGLRPRRGSRSSAGRWKQEGAPWEKEIRAEELRARPWNRGRAVAEEGDEPGRALLVPDVCCG
jgi:hypothetical protein